MNNQRVLGSASAVALLLLTSMMMMMMMAVGAPAADAQRVDCENVTYNERIVRVCTTVEDAAEPVATPTPVPTSTPTPVLTATPSTADDDKDEDEADPTLSGEDDDDATDDVEEPDAEPNDQPDSVDRGDRGSRSLDAESLAETPSVEARAGDQTAGTDEDEQREPADVSRPDDADNGDETTATNGDGDEPSDQSEVTEAAAGSGVVFDSTANPPPDNVALIASLVALVGLGGVFFLGARANRRDDSHE